MVFLTGGDFQSALKAISPRAAAFTSGSGALSILIVCASLIVVMGAVMLFVRSRWWFWGFLISGFALSEIEISVLNYFGFVIRYTFICVIISAGIVALLSGDQGPGKTVRVLGMAYLGWLLISLAVHGVSGETATMLPMQIALMLGLFWGLMQDFRETEDAKWLCTMLGRLGAIFTLLHASSIVMAAEPFLNSRFKSYFVLPTNFADRYALLYIAMIWAALTDGALFRRSAMWACVALGAVLLVMSGTRNAILMVLAAACVFSLVWKVRIPIVVAAILAGVFVVIASFLEDISGIQFAAGRISNLDASNRYAVWALAWERISEHPWVGYGLGRAGSTMQQGVEWYSRATFIDAHNAFLGIWLQLGIMGLILIVLLYLHTFAIGLRLVSGKTAVNDPELRRVVALPLAIVFALFLGGMFEDNLTSRGSLPQLLWGVSILIISSLSGTGTRDSGMRNADYANGRSFNY